MATIRPTGYLAHYGFSEEDVLEHYGVKGMKWGKRKALRMEMDRYNAKLTPIVNDMRYLDRKGLPDAHLERVQSWSKSASERQHAAQKYQGLQNKYNALNAKRISYAKKWQKAQKEYEDSRLDKVISRGAKSAAENGKKKIKDLLKAADAGWNKSRARDTAIAAANKASDVVESIRNKDGSISFKKKKKS